MRNDQRRMLDQICQNEESSMAIEQTSSHQNNTIHLDQEQSENIDDVLDAASKLSEDVSEALQFFTPRDSLSISNCSVETSSTFYPEQYVVEGPSFERILVFSMVNFSRTTTARVDIYCLLFAKDARHWSRVTVIATVPQALTEVDSSHITNANLILPGQIQPQLEAVMDRADALYSTTRIQILVKPSSEGGFVFDESSCEIFDDTAEESTLEILHSGYLEEVRCRGLPEYLESEIIVLTKVRSFEHLVLVESQQCIEKKLPFTGSSRGEEIDEFFADMKLLLLAQGCPRVLRFKGVVLNDDRTRICSYLIEHHRHLRLTQIMDLARVEKQLIPWDRREKWIRQIITTIAEIHKRGSFVGGLLSKLILLDLSDNIIVHSFKSKGGHLRNERGLLAPEFRQRCSPGTTASGQALTIQADIFSLGRIIYDMARPNSVVWHDFCSNSGCKTFPRYRCAAEHTNPVHLPPCTDADIPEYIDTIISSCRQEIPIQRKSASTLLRMLLPHSGQPPDSRHRPLCPPFEYSSSLIDRIQRPSTYCSECMEPQTDRYYHCNACDQGDFDLCLDCVAKGVHCFDNAHILTPRVIRDGKRINIPAIAE